MDGLQIGQRAAVRRVFTAEDLAEYAALAGDTNPVFGGAAPGRPIVPGALLGGMFSYLLGTTLPGPGTNYLKQRLRFLAAAHVGEELTAEVEIVRIRPEKALVDLRTVCTNRAGEVVCEGEALVLVADRTVAPG